MKTNFSLGSILLFVLFIAHAARRRGRARHRRLDPEHHRQHPDAGEGKILFVFTSLVMFALRFCADFIEKHLGISPIGILLICSLLAWSACGS